MTFIYIVYVSSWEGRKDFSILLLVMLLFQCDPILHCLFSLPHSAPSMITVVQCCPFTCFLPILCLTDDSETPFVPPSLPQQPCTHLTSYLPIQWCGSMSAPLCVHFHQNRAAWAVSGKELSATLPVLWGLYFSSPNYSITIHPFPLMIYIFFSPSSYSNPVPLLAAT